MNNVEGAQMRLYEDPDLRDELRDPEAALLLRWAEARTAALGVRADFEAAFDALAETVRKMNRFVGRHAAWDAEQRETRLRTLLDSARGAGLAADETAVAALLADLGSLDDAALVQRLTGLFGGEHPAATTPARPVAPPAPTSPFDPFVSDMTAWTASDPPDFSDSPTDNTGDDSFDDTTQ